MKTRILFLLILLYGIIGTTRAQTVTIPDTALASCLRASPFGGCMTGNQLDTACANALSYDTVKCSTHNVRDMTGIQYLHNVIFIDCSHNYITSLPSLPPPLQYLDCSYNRLTTLPALPNNLQNIVGTWNLITTLPALDLALRNLNVTENQLTSLPALPSNLATLNCEFNHLTSVPALPQFLYTLACGSNQITVMPVFNNYLSSVYYEYNPLVAQPTWTPYLNTINCSGTGVTTVQPFPSGLLNFLANDNNIASLPPLPSTMNTLVINDNQLTVIPTLPASFRALFCIHNNLTTITNLPDILTALAIDSNPQLTCLPPFHYIQQLEFRVTGITCLPDYGTVLTSSPSLSTIPVCNTFNTHSCTPFWNLAGRSYYTDNNNCVFDSIDVGLGNVKVMMYQNGVLQQQTFTGGDGFYSFDVHNVYGTYNTKVDTTGFPFYVSCPSDDWDTAVISTADSFISNNDFAMQCKPGYDVGVIAIVGKLQVRPAQFVTVGALAGDISQLYYGAHCARGISGQVKMVFSGAITYQHAANGALTPSSVTGDTIIWNIADFGAVNGLTDFNVMFKVDNSNTYVGTFVCYDVTVTSNGTENTLTNNHLSYCQKIVAAYDPNVKEVYPEGPIDTTQKWLTYTVRFQNTGSAPALNIYVDDTLDANLDASTIELLAYSHHNITQVLPGGIVRFNFPNINLPDSTTNEPASHGYIQYKIKVKNGVPIGTIIHNTGYIYFDNNPAIATNTTSTFYGTLTPAIVTTQPTTFCQGDSVMLQANDFAGYPIQWLNNGTPISSETNATITAKNTGTYSVRVYYAGDSATSMAVNVIVNSNPTVTLHPDTNYTNCTNPPLKLNGVPPGGTYTGSGVTDSLFNPQVANHGMDSISYQYIDTNGCSGYAKTAIFDDICEGIDNISTPQITIYPNPTNDVLNISIDGNGSYIVKLYGINGMLLQTQTISNGTSAIDMGNLAGGMYYLEVGNSQGKVMKKVVKM